jgi:hypothetical protein
VKTENQKILAKHDTFKDLMKNYIGSGGTLADIAVHGAHCGYALLSYTSDILEVFGEYQREIEDVVGEMNKSCGYSTAAGFAAYCERNGFDGSHTEYVTWLVWSAAELIAQQEEGEEQ